MVFGRYEEGERRSNAGELPKAQGNWEKAIGQLVGRSFPIKALLLFS